MFYKETEFKDTPIGKTPKQWELKRIRNACKVVTGGTPSTKHPEYFGENIKWLKSGDIKQLYIYDTTEKLTQLGIENSNAKTYPSGSVAIALSGRGQTRGRTTITKAPMACSQSVAFMIPNSELLAEYLHYNLANRYMEIRNLTGHLDRSGLNLSIVSDILIPIPSLEEQRVVVGVLGVVDSAIGLVDKVIAKTERLKKGLMQTLLTKGLNVLTIYHNEIISAIEDCRRHVTTSEWNLAHHLAESLKRVFEKYDVDVELIKDPTNERPDIVVHKRGVNDYNLLAIEVKIKPTKTDVQQDVEKLERLMLGKYLYRSALFVGYDTTLKNEETFSLSKEVNFILVRPDGRLDSKFVEDHKEYKNTPIGEIPKNWELVRIRELGELQYGYTTSAVQENTGTKFLRITDIEEDGSVNWEQVPYCHIDGDEFGKYALQKGDLLFARIGATAGKTTYINENARGIFASYLIRLKVKEGNANPKFVFYFTQSTTYWSQALRQREGQLKKGINATMLSNFTVPLPSFEEQHGTAEILSAIDHKLELERKEKARLERVKRGLMDLLLTGKVRIKVD